jgi:glycyl-radical enzyme activating protein
MTTGLLFDLQRTSLHDGPGIRTAVFLKGCPLHCVWCHNPESQSGTKEISFRPEVCVACGACASACTRGAHRIAAGAHHFDRALCQLCGKCADACLSEALKMAGREYTVEGIMSEVRRDALYYRRSGGGVTLTGGEPMLQPEFALELLNAARAEGIHTCLETCGWASQRAYENVLPFVDLFLFDYKATDPEIHRRLTGVSNDLILANLDFLYRQGANVQLRCPLVPGVNDAPEHLAGIAAVSKKYPRIETVELLPYHNLGNVKYERYGQVNPMPGLETASETVKQDWASRFCALGIAPHIG